MKIPRFLLVSALSLTAAAPLLADTTFTGNGNSSFGGYIGGSSLTLSSTSAGAINFSLTTPTQFGGNAFVLYLDSTAGGFSDTSTFTDNGDGGREAAAGYNASNPSRAQLNFASGFTADYAVVVEPAANFAGIFKLASNTSFTYINSANLAANSGQTQFTFSVNESDIGASGGQNINLVGSLISTTAYRSDEAYGGSTLDGNPGSPGFNGSVTFSGFDTYTTVVPEPSLGLALGLGLVVSVGLLRGIRRQAQA